MTINSEILSDALKIGVANAVLMSLVAKVFPNNLVTQMFISGTLFHIITEMVRVKNGTLELSEYN
jgi:hypothetical protein